MAFSWTHVLAYTCLRILSGLINQSTNGKNFILTSVCIHTYIYICVSMYVWKHRQGGGFNSLHHLWEQDREAGDAQIPVLSLCPPCHTGGDNLEGLFKSVTIFTLGENHDLDYLPIDKT